MIRVSLNLHLGHWESRDSEPGVFSSFFSDSNRWSLLRLSLRYKRIIYSSTHWQSVGQPLGSFVFCYHADWQNRSFSFSSNASFPRPNVRRKRTKKKKGGNRDRYPVCAVSQNFGMHIHCCMRIRGTENEFTKTNRSGMVSFSSVLFAQLGEIEV
jgi:hypothetical protein